MSSSLPLQSDLLAHAVEDAHVAERVVAGNARRFSVEHRLREFIRLQRVEILVRLRAEPFARRWTARGGVVLSWRNRAANREAGLPRGRFPRPGDFNVAL